MCTKKSAKGGGDMIICDRCWKRDGQPVAAAVHIVLAGPELEEEYNLSAAEAELVRNFINNPSLWCRKSEQGKVREILSLKAKAK